MHNRLSRTAALACIAALLSSTGALAQSAAPANRAPAPVAAAAPRAPAFANIQQVCQLRERELIGVNTQLLGRNQAAAAEKDPAKRAQILQPTPNLMTNLRETEASWNRMDCARLLYGAR